MKFLKQIFFLFCMFIFWQNWGQFTIPPKPKNAQAVYDYAKLLKKEEQKALNEKLIAYADSTSTQIVVAIIPTLKGEYEGMLAPEWAQQWGIGQKGKDNGVFILLAQKERKIWISPGYGLEHKLTAGRNGEIIRNFIIPEFKKGNFYNGLNIGTDKLINLFSGTYKADTVTNNTNFSDIFFLLFVIFIGIFFIFFRKKTGKINNQDTEVLADIFFTILSAKGSQSFSQKSFGNNNKDFFGGFSGGFGGGGFSGGGAGGSW